MIRPQQPILHKIELTPHNRLYDANVIEKGAWHVAQDYFVMEGDIIEFRYLLADHINQQFRLVYFE